MYLMCICMYAPAQDTGTTAYVLTSFKMQGHCKLCLASTVVVKMVGLQG